MNAAHMVKGKMLLVFFGALVVVVLVWVVLYREKPAPAVPAKAPRGAPRPEDEDDAERREIDAATLRAARETVTFVVPDAVLADALQHTDTRGLAQAFAGVDAAVLADAMGHASQEGQAVRAEDLWQLRGAEGAIDDLEIWSFGNT